MVWDVMVAAAFVVVSVAVLVCFAFKFILNWLKKPSQVAPRLRVLVSSLFLRRAVVKSSVKRTKQRPSPPDHCCTSFRERLGPPNLAH